MAFLSVSIQSDAAKMSSYQENTTPNEDVYFIGVDPNDTTQTANGSNYRYPLSSILGSGLFDLDVNSLTVSGTGDSWIELENNTSFTDTLTGKYGLRFYNGVLQQIINGTASALGSGVVDDTTYGESWNGVTDEAPSKNAVYDKIVTITEAGAPTVQADDPTSESSNGWYCATTSGDTFYKTTVGLFNVSAGTYTADPTIPTLTSLTIPTTGDTATAVFSEAMTVGAAGNGGWTLNTPTNAMTYASGSGTDTIVFNLASVILDADVPTVTYTQPGNGWESNDDQTDLASITEAVVINNSTETGADPDPAIQYNLEDNASSSTVVAAFGSNAAYYVGNTLTNTSTATNAGAIEGSACFKLPAGGGVQGTFGNIDDDGVFTVDFYIYGDGNGSQTGYPRLIASSTLNHLTVRRNNSDTLLQVYVGGSEVGSFTVDDMANTQWQNFRLVFEAGASGNDFELYQRSHNGTSWGSWTLKGSVATFTTPAMTIFRYGVNTDGANSWGSDVNDYRIDQLRIWDAAVRP